MPPRRDFGAKRTLKVVSFKGGKAVKKTKLNIPVRYTVSSASACPSTSDSTTEDVSLIPDDPDLPHGFDDGSNKPKQARFKKRRIKRKLKAYHEGKATLAASWLNAREQLIAALISRQALPISQSCMICKQAAIGRCPLSRSLKNRSCRRKIAAQTRGLEGQQGCPCFLIDISFHS